MYLVEKQDRSTIPHLAVLRCFRDGAAKKDIPQAIAANVIGTPE